MGTKRISGKHNEFEAFFGTQTLRIPVLSSGEVIQILGITSSRLERFLENYSLSAGQSGRGQGSRRLFSPDDVHRLAIAKWLLDDRFQPELVGEIIEDLEDRHLVEHDKNGEKYQSIILVRQADNGKGKHEFVPSRSGKGAPKKDCYYILDLWPLMADVNQRIKTVLEKRGKG